MRIVATFIFITALHTAALAAQDCEPSHWGPDDQLGSANRVTAESVLAASRLIKTGKTYALGIVVDDQTPAFAPRNFNLQVVQPGQQFGRQSMPNLTYNDDILVSWLGIGSQLDGLGHIGDARGMYYNCHDGREFSDLSGLTRLGVHQIPPLVARGVVLDMAGHKGVTHMKAGEYFTVADVQAVEKKQGTPIGEGDVVLFHTGWTEAMLEKDPDAWVAGEPGQSEEVASYLAAKGVLAVGADTWGVDVVPPPDPERPFQGHVILLKEHGIYLLETMNTGPLVRDQAFEFLFVLGQARVRGAVQMMINPVAIR